MRKWQPEKSKLFFLFIFVLSLLSSGHFAFEPVAVKDLTAKEKLLLNRGEILTRTVLHSSIEELEGVEAQFLIHTTQGKLKAALVDYENFPKIFPQVKKINILRREPGGAHIEMIVEGVIQDIRYTLHRRHEPNRIWWTRESGDLEIIEGEWLIEPFSPGKLLVTYHTFLKAGGIYDKLAGPMIRRRSFNAAVDAVNGLRNYMAALP